MVQLKMGIFNVQEENTNVQSIKLNERTFWS